MCRQRLSRSRAPLLLSCPPPYPAVSTFVAFARIAPSSTENRQSAEVLAEEQARIERGFLPIAGPNRVRAIRMSCLPSTRIRRRRAARRPSALQDSRLRGVILHKLTKELATGKLNVKTGETRETARVLCRQLARDGTAIGKPDPGEMGDTALRTFTLPELQPFIQRSFRKCRCTAERPTGADELISSRADAVALSDDGDLVVFDRKSDVAPRRTKPNGLSGATRSDFTSWAHTAARSCT
jgi:CRISPR-associated exonuclease Cas4